VVEKTTVNPLNAEAAALAEEIKKADTPDKLIALEVLCADLCKKLTEASLPKLEKRILELVAEQMQKLGMNNNQLGE
jgi:hypothetical protein